MIRLTTEPDHDVLPGLPAFEVRLRTHRRTVLVQLFGELDLATVPQLAAAFDSLNLDEDGFRHVVLDLRGLTFMDGAGVHELVRQRRAADENHHNLSVVRGRPSIHKLMSITDVDTGFVLVDSPEDLEPPSFGSRHGSPSGIADAGHGAQITLVPDVTDHCWVPPGLV